MIGKKFGMFTVIKDTGKRTKSRGTIYLCKCDCGNMKEIRYNLLTREDRPRSCGCSKKIRARKQFESHIDKSKDCWEWTGNLNQGGYGKFGSGSKKAASRIAWEYEYGPIPAKLQVCHTCDNRKCVNPEHLFLGSISDNMADKVKKQRQAKGSKIGSSIITEEIALEIRKMRISGKDYEEIANHFSIGWDLTRKVCKNVIWKHVPMGEECAKVKQNRRNALGSACGSSKIKEEDVIEIRKLIDQGVRGKDIAAKFGINASTLCDIKKGRTWQHVPMTE